jgi:hypothetical protein
MNGKERNEKSRYLNLPAFIIPKKRRDISIKLKHLMEKKSIRIEKPPINRGYSLGSLNL